MHDALAGLPRIDGAFVRGDIPWTKARLLARVATAGDEARWLDRADGYAHMAGLYGQLAAIDPARDLVVVVNAHIPGEVDSSAITRWLLEEYVLPAAG